MNTYDHMVSQLLSCYQDICHVVSPEWAVRQRNCPTDLVLPTIPFVGKHYAEQSKRILVYASAESLTDYYPGSENTRPWLEDRNQAMNRHRALFESSDRFFPDVHIQPMYDGTLATAIFYIATSALIGYERNGIKPNDFYEKIAFGNYSKYTMATERQRNIYIGNGNFGNDINIDPTRMPAKQAREVLNCSHPYLEKDIEILQPDIIILPEGLERLDKYYLHYLESAKNVKFIGIYQLGPTPIHCTIPQKYPIPRNIDSDPTLREWVSNIQRVSKDKFLHIFDYLDSKL